MRYLQPAHEEYKFDDKEDWKVDVRIVSNLLNPSQYFQKDFKINDFKDDINKKSSVAKETISYVFLVPDLR